MNEKKYLLLLFFILLLSTFLTTFRITQESLWYDELVSAYSITHHSFWQLISYIPEREGSPPFYFLLLSLWSKLGTSPFILRLLSAICGTFSVIGIYFLGKELKDKETGLISSFLFSISPFTIWYSQEARQYSLLILLVILSSFFFVKFMRKESKVSLISYIITSFFMLYTHSHAIFVYFTQILYFLLLSKHRKKVIFLLLPFLLWLPYFFHLLKIINKPFVKWLPYSTWLTPFLIFYNFTFGPYNIIPKMVSFFGYWLFLIVFTIGSYKLYRKDRKDFLFFLFFIPYVLVILTSLKIPLIFEGKRFLSIILPFYFLIIAWKLRKFSPLLRSLFLLSITFFLIFPLKFSYTHIQKREWKKSAIFLMKKVSPEDALFSIGMRGEFLSYYGFKPHILKFPERVTNKIVEKEIKKYKRIWIISINNNFSPFEKFLRREGNLKNIKIFKNSLGQIIRISLFSKT